MIKPMVEKDALPAPFLDEMELQSNETPDFTITKMEDNKNGSLTIREQEEVISPTGIEKMTKPGILSILKPMVPAMQEFENALEHIPHVPNGIVFPWDEEKQKFVFEDYHLELAEDRLTREEIQEVFLQLKQSEYYDMYGDMHFKLMLPFLAMVILAAVLLFFYQALLREVSGWLIILGVIMGMFLVLLISAWCWSHFLRIRFNLREASFREILNNVNQWLFVDKKVQWSVGHFGSYIELDIKEESEDDRIRRMSKSHDFTGTISIM